MGLKEAYTTGNNLKVSVTGVSDNDVMYKVTLTVDNGPQILHLPDILKRWAARGADFVQDFLAQTVTDFRILREEV